MEELLENLARSNDPSTVASTNDYFASCIQNEEFGAMLIENLHENEAILSDQNILTSILGLFSNWISVHWGSLPNEFKAGFFSLITIGPIIITRPTIFTKRIEKDYKYREMYEQFLFDIIGQLNETMEPQQLASYTYLLMIIIKKYKNPGTNECINPEELYDVVVSSILPILQADAYTHSPIGHMIVHHVMRIFLSLFTRLQRDPDELSPLINFITAILDAYISGQIIEDRLLSKCSRGMLTILMIPQLKDEFDELRASLFDKYVQAVSIAVEQQKSSNLIYWLLIILRYCCNGFPDSVELMELFIKASHPLPSDLQNFHDNPIVFYEDVYGIEQNTQILLARSYVGEMMEYEDCAQAFMEMDMDETTVRIAGVAIPAIVEHIGFENVSEYVLTALSGIESGETPEMDAAAQIALALGTVNDLDVDTQTLLMESMAIHMRRNPVLTCLCADLIKELLDCDIYPESEVIDELVAAIPEFPSHYIIECLSKILKYVPNEVFPRAVEVTQAIVSTIRSETDSLKSDDFGSNTLLVSSLDMLEALISAGKSSFVIEHTIEPIHQLFKIADDEGILTALLRICAAIFEAQSEAKQTVLEIMTEAINENPVIPDVIDEFFEALMPAISRPAPIPFAECGVGQTIISGTIKAIVEYGDSIGLCAAFDMLAWLVLGEPTVDASELVDFAASLFERPLQDYELFGVIEVFAAVTVASGFMPPDEVVSASITLFRDHMIYRKFDRLLFMLFVCQLLENGAEPTELASILVEMLMEYSKWIQLTKKQQEKLVSDFWDNFSDNFNLRAQYFNLASPIDGVNIMEKITSALQHCPRELLFSLHDTYPSAFNDD